MKYKPKNKPKIMEWIKVVERNPKKGRDGSDEDVEWMLEALGWGKSDKRGD